MLEAPPHEAKNAYSRACAQRVGSAVMSQEASLLHAHTLRQVQRSKNRWKCVLKSGVMHINGRDVLFKSCQGEMNF